MYKLKRLYFVIILQFAVVLAFYQGKKNETDFVKKVWPVMFSLFLQEDSGLTRPVQNLDFFKPQTSEMFNHLEISLISSKLKYAR